MLFCQFNDQCAISRSQSTPFLSLFSRYPQGKQLASGLVCCQQRRSSSSPSECGGFVLELYTLNYFMKKKSSILANDVPFDPLWDRSDKIQRGVWVCNIGRWVCASSTSRIRWSFAGLPMCGADGSPSSIDALLWSLDEADTPILTNDDQKPAHMNGTSILTVGRIRNTFQKLLIVHLPTYSSPMVKPLREVLSIAAAQSLVFLDR